MAVKQIGLAATAATHALTQVAADARYALQASGTVNVRDLGAVGDGVADDSAAIASGLDLIHSRSVTREPGGVLYFPPGVYRLSSPVQVPRNVVLIGESPYATRLVYSGPNAHAFITVGSPGTISTYSGIESIWVDGAAKVEVVVDLYGPQEGTRIADAMLVNGLDAVVDIHSAGILGGSNKFTIERSWLWTTGARATAGVRMDQDSGPLSIRDTTMVGTNRGGARPPSGSAGIVASGAKVVLDSINVEYFESHSYFDRTLADVRSPTASSVVYGIVTSEASIDATLLVSNAVFHDVEACIVDRGAGVTIPFARSYQGESYTFDQRHFARNFANLGEARVWQEPQLQGSIGYVSPATADTTRFKISAMTDGVWQESAAVDPDGTFGSAGSGWRAPHLRLGEFHLWIDLSGALRMKKGSPNFDGDGTIVGSQG